MALRICFITLFLFGADLWSREIVVGSKNFTEGYILGELVAQNLEKSGFVVKRKLGMGGTGVVFTALESGAIDLYVEYTGTISEAILKKPEIRGLSAIQGHLAELGISVGEPLGFSNNYAFAIRPDVASQKGLRRISDLKPTLDLKAGLSHEFVSREDGLRGVRRHYQDDLFATVTSMAHALSYEAIASGRVDIIDVYTTDAKISELDLVLLEDDKSYFPDYQAVILVRTETLNQSPGLQKLLGELAGRIDQGTMQSLNAEVDLLKKPYAQVVTEYLGRETGGPSHSDPLGRLLQRTGEHLYMVVITLGLCMLVGLPLGYIAGRKQSLGQIIVMTSSLFQTIPSLALLCFLIPFFGVGLKPALVALFLYGLLPIVVNTVSGIRSIDPKLIEVSRTLGFSETRKFFAVELPLAAPHILGGIRTSAIISIGTATLAALIGAGGYGAPIVEGLAINDMNRVLFGAIPAAVMALVVHGLFEGIEWLSLRPYK